MTTSLLDLMGDQGQAPREIAADAPSAPQNKTEHCELELVLFYDNEARGEIFAGLDGNEASSVWLKKSDIQITDTGRTVAGVTTQGKPIGTPLSVIAVNIPEQLAREKGLI